MSLIPSEFIDFMKDVEHGLYSSYPNLSEHEVHELATYIVTLLYDRDEEWKLALKQAGVNVCVSYKEPKEGT